MQVQARDILQLLMARERLKRDKIELSSDIVVAQVRGVVVVVVPKPFTGGGGGGGGDDDDDDDDDDDKLNHPPSLPFTGHRRPRRHLHLQLEAHSRCAVADSRDCRVHVLAGLLHEDPDGTGTYRAGRGGQQGG